MKSGMVIVMSYKMDFYQNQYCSLYKNIQCTNQTFKPLKGMIGLNLVTVGKFSALISAMNTRHEDN